MREMVPDCRVVTRGGRRDKDGQDCLQSHARKLKTTRLFSLTRQLGGLGLFNVS